MNKQLPKVSQGRNLVLAALSVCLSTMRVSWQSKAYSSSMYVSLSCISIFCKTKKSRKRGRLLDFQPKLLLFFKATKWKRKKSSLIPRGERDGDPIKKGKVLRIKYLNKITKRAEWWGIFLRLPLCRRSHSDTSLHPFYSFSCSFSFRFASLSLSLSLSLILLLFMLFIFSFCLSLSFSLSLSQTHIRTKLDLFCSWRGLMNISMGFSCGDDFVSLSLSPSLSMAFIAVLLDCGV
jgi:hypothetical protein